VTDAKLVPLHPVVLQETKPIWLPFLESIARQDKDDINALVARVESLEVHLIMIWDAASAMPLALFGLRVFLRGEKRIAEGVWLTGSARHLWVHLLPQLEEYVSAPDGMNCQGVKFPHRPGWTRMLRNAGYRETHRISEKALT
jgi:hypothetical protein